MMQSTLDRMATLGRFSLDLLAALGRAGVFFWQLVRAMGPAMRRPYLVVAQIHAVGNRSLSIILASGLAVGFGADREPVSGARVGAGGGGSAVCRPGWYVTDG